MSAAGPHETVERALELSRADGTVVIVEERSSANLRWALNALTTNGQTRGRQVTVIATVNGATGVSVGVVSRSAAADGEVEALVRAAEEAARQSPTSDEAAPLVPGTAAPASADFAEAPAETSSAVFAEFAPALGETFARAAREGRELFGFAEHELVSSYLGTSTGLRLRHDQATGSLELNAKSDGRRRSSFATVPVHDFATVDIGAMDASLAARLAWGDRTVELPPGRYETLLPPSSVADLLLYQHLTVDARRSHEGRTVFSRPGGGTRVGERLTALPMTLSSDPGAEGMAAAPFVLSRSSAESFLASNSVFDNGLPLGRTEWIADGTLRTLTNSRHSAELTGLPLAPVGGQPAAGRRRHRLAGRTGRDHRARPPGHLPVVHPRGGPEEPVADRVDQGRGLPGRGWSGGRAGQQLPVQRVPGGGHRPGHRGVGDRADPFPGVGDVLPEGGDAGAAGARVPHELGQPRRVRGRS